MTRFSFPVAIVACAALLGSLVETARATIVPGDSGLISIPNGALNSQVVSAWTTAEGSPPVNAATDLLINQLASAPTFSGTMEFASTLSNINDGLMVGNEVAGAGTFNTTNMAAFSSGGNLDFLLNGLYNINRIDSFTAYLGTRVGQDYSLSVSSNGGATWTPLTSVNFDNSPDNNNSYVRGVSLTNSPSGPIAFAVDGLRFTFATPTGDVGQGGDAVYAEIAAYGVLVPEPATNVLLAVGAAGLGLAIRRRRARSAN